MGKTSMKEFSKRYQLISWLHLAKVSGHSMTPTLAHNDLLVCSKRAKVNRGQLIVFNNPLIPEMHLVKRLIGMPGDLLSLCDGSLYINGSHLLEPYLHGGPAASDLKPYEARIPQESIFVLSDDRVHPSTDSRVCGFIRLKDIHSFVKYRVWPLNRIGPID